MRTPLAFARPLTRGWSAALLGLLFAGRLAWGTTITIVNLDGPGEGFNDPTPVAPVGGNPGTTVGAQRLYVFQYAANVWAHVVQSPVEILVDSNFDPLDCDGSSAVLGSAGPNTIHSDFDGAQRPMTWYHQALANRLSGVDQDPTTSDIGATFNSDIGKPECFPLPWYYGVDGNEGISAVELLPVVIHELGHGLGFSTSTIAGVEEVFPSIYDWFLYDDTQGMHWPDMTEAQRAASAQNCSNLAWDGANVMAAAPARLGPKPLLRVNSPSLIAGDMGVGLASFGPPLEAAGVTGDVVLVNDGAGVPTNGCEPFTNAAAIAGKIALVDRGGCTFVTKVLNAQAAGAIAVVVADSVPGCPALGMGGASNDITIPAVRITQDDGARIKNQLLLGSVNATLISDPALHAGADGAGRVLMFSPLPYQTGPRCRTGIPRRTPICSWSPRSIRDCRATSISRARHSATSAGKARRSRCPPRRRGRVHCSRASRIPPRERRRSHTRCRARSRSRSRSWTRTAASSLGSTRRAQRDGLTS
jgi:hypothetical protein